MATQVIAGPLPVERDSEQARKRRRAWIAWLAVILAIFLCLFTCGQLSLLGAAPDTSGMASGSAMNADYAAWQGWSFGPLLPQIALEAIRDLGMGNPFQVATSTACLLGNTCPTGTVVSPSSTPLGGPSATPTGGASPTPVAPTRTRTPVTTATNQPATSTPTITPTPTPLVYPVKLANPVNIPPGSTSVEFTIMVINYGNPTGAVLTEVIDRLPPEMSFGGGCSPAGCTNSGNEVRWSGSWMIGQGSFRTFRFTANVAGTLAGDVLTNQVETQGGNFETAVNVRRVYVYTPTATATPIAIPTAVDDVARTDEDVPAVVNVLANDTNLRDVPMTVSIAVVPGFGSAVVLAGNTIRYTPNPNWFGVDTFQYRVTDASVPVGDWDIGLVTVIVDPVNDTPVAIDDNPLGVPLPVLEDTPAAFNVLANDTGIGDTPLLVTILSGPSQGSAIVLVSNQIRYQGNLNYNGPDSLVYRVTDVDGEFDDATLSISVLPVNDRPVAFADNGYSVIEDTPGGLDTALLPGPPPPNASVLTNDFDVEGNPLQATFPSVPANGTLTLRLDGTFVYTPRANFFGTDSFTYWAYDGLAYSAAPASVLITVIDDPDDVPNAVNDAYAIAEDTPTMLSVLANDGGVVDIPVSVTITDAPDHGSAWVQIINGASIPPDIRIWYSPLPNENSILWGGPDLLTYQVCDDDLECDTAIVTLTVIAVHDPPTTVADAYNMLEDQTATFLLPSVLANDLTGDLPIDPDSVCIVGRPCPIMGFPIWIAGGRITDIDPASGAIEFEPNDDFNGVVAFEYTVADTPLGARSAPAAVSITVTPTNDTPFAVDDQSQTILGVPVNINVLLNDIGIGDIPLALSVVAPIPNPLQGTCTVQGNQIRFTPDVGFNGTVQCGYRVTDADLEFDEAVITIYVNRPPTAVDDPTPLIGPPIVTNEDVNVVVNVLANDSDVDDGLDPSTVTIINAPGNGSIFAINPLTGAITYRPNLGYHGPDSFTYRVRDLHVPAATSNTARVNITVSSINSLPDAQPDAAFTQQNTPIRVNVLANDSDPDVPPDPLTITGVVDPNPPPTGILSTTIIDDNGTPLIPADDRVVYTPGPGAWGTEILSYTIDDGAGGTDASTISVRVNGWPTANPDSALTAEDTSVDVSVLANDSDPDSLPPGWRVVSVTDPPRGSAVVVGGLIVRYSPDPNYTGSETFDYTMIDGEGGSSSASVTVTISEADDTPIANDDPGLGFPALQVGEGQTISINVLANDVGLGDEPLTVAVTAGPTFPGCASPGLAQVIGSPGPASGIRIQYTAPTQECSGGVTFQYTITDGDLIPPQDSASAWVFLTVLPVNDPPVANDDPEPPIVWSTFEDNPVPLILDVALNDTDVDGTIDLASVAIASCPGGASCSPNGDGTVDFLPPANFAGTYAFTYTIRDNLGAPSAPATVRVSVTPVNDPPTAVDDSRSTNQGTPVTINAVGNDYDIDGSVVASSAAAVGGPANGTVFNNGDGTFTYTPNVAPFSSDSFTYQVWDNDGAPSNVATVTIGINQPDLTVNKDAIPDSAAPGEEVQFFISIINNGPGTAFSVSVSDDLGDCFHWVGSPSFGSLGDLDQGEARVLAPRARVDAAPSPGCDNTNRAEVTAVNASTSDDTVSVSILTPPTMLFSMMMPVELTPLGSPTPTESVEPTLTAEASGTPTTDPADPTLTVSPEVSETSTAVAPEETPSASVAPPTAEGTATAEKTPVETGAPTDPPTEAPPTPEPVVVPTEEATAVPEPSEPPAPAPEPPGPVPEPPMPEPQTEPLGGEEAPAVPPGGGEEPPSESMAAVLSNVRWDRLSRRPLWGRADGVYAASDSRWLLRYLFGLFAPPGAPTVSPTPMPGP